MNTTRYEELRRAVDSIKRNVYYSYLNGDLFWDDEPYEEFRPASKPEPQGASLSDEEWDSLMGNITKK